VQRADADSATADLGAVGDLTSLPDAQLFQRYSETGSEACIAEIQRRYPDSEEALRRVLQTNYRPPHSATAKVTLRGRIVWTGSAQSGGSTPELRRQLGLWRANQAVHTEPKLITAARAAGALTPGTTLWITGQYDPCGPCQRTMRAAATDSIRVDYWWPGGTWRA
jgi:hypothetical protein